MDNFRQNFIWSRQEFLKVQIRASSVIRHCVSYKKLWKGQYFGNTLRRKPLFFYSDRSWLYLEKWKSTLAFQGGVIIIVHELITNYQIIGFFCLSFDNLKLTKNQTKVVVYCFKMNHIGDCTNATDAKVLLHAT